MNINLPCASMCFDIDDALEFSGKSELDYGLP